jgi:hypothetical protein
MEKSDKTTGEVFLPSIKMEKSDKTTRKYSFLA